MKMKEKSETHSQNLHSTAKDTDQKKKKDIKSEKQDKKPHSDTCADQTKKTDVSKKVTVLEQFVKEWQDKYLRLSAEFDNYRKRTLKEKAELIIHANEDLLKDILPVIDDFDRGINHIDKSEDMNAMKEGIHLIYNKFSDFLRQKGIKEIDAVGKPFDIDFHEAMTKLPAPSEEDKGKILDVLEKGYMLNDKVIRYARVVVGD